MSTRPRKPRRPARSTPPDVEIRVMELRDLQGIFALGQQLFTADRLPTLYRSWDEQEIAQLFTAEAETCLVAVAGEAVVGFALGRILEKPRSAWRYGWLEWLGVDPTFKRRGVATRLLNQLTERFIDRDARILLVDTDEENADALAFFRRLGFGQELRHVYLSQNLEDHPRYLEKRNGTR